MRNLTLTTKLPSGKSWTEELPEGAVEQSTGSFGADFGQKVLNIKIAGGLDGYKNLQMAIWKILGYSECISTVTGFPFDPTNSGISQDPYKLTRHTPCKHPTFQGLYATKILSCTGRGISRQGPNSRVDGTDGNYEFIYLSILFEIPKYPILSDTELQNVQYFKPAGAANAASVPEYWRYTLFDYEHNFETIARKGQQWYAVSAAAAAITLNRSFVGDRYIRQPKGVLKITWFDVHEDFVKLAKLLPQSLSTRISTLNARPFPYYWRRRQNGAGNFTGSLPTGTLLLQPPKLETRTQNHPAALSGQIDVSYFPRTVDITLTMLHFDPKTDDNLTIDLSAATYGPDGALWDASLVRGHQLAPLIRPSQTGYVWYAFVNDSKQFDTRPNTGPHTYYDQNPAALGLGAAGVETNCIFNGIYYRYTGPPNSWPGAGRGADPPNPAFWTAGLQYDTSLLYQYSNFEALFQAVTWP